MEFTLLQPCVQAAYIVKGVMEAWFQESHDSGNLASVL